MSSTNRGYERHKSDYYVTPQAEIKKFTHQIAKDDVTIAAKMLNGNILDPCAGGDAEHEMSYPEVLDHRVNDMMTIDIREDSRAEIKEDYFRIGVEIKPDIIISNPPFRDAMRFIKKSLDDVKTAGYVIYLLRLNFFGSQKRYEFWQKYMPKYTYIHHKRMSFTDEGGTDSIEYAHFVWQKDYYPEFSQVKVI